MPDKETKKPKNDKEKKDKKPTPKPKPDPVPDEDEVVDPWEGFVVNNAPGPGGGPPQADSVAPRGTKQWKRAVEARRKWEGDQLHRQAALTGGRLDDPEQLKKMLRDIGIWEFNPDDPNKISHKWNLWTGNLPTEGFGMSDIGGNQLPFATQRYMPDWKHNRDYAVQGGHLLKSSTAGEYISPQNDGTANVQDQFGNVIGNIPWPPQGPPPVPAPNPLAADSPTATDLGPTPLARGGGGVPGGAGFGAPPGPGDIQSLTNSMAGFSPLMPTPAPGASAAQSKPTMGSSGPTVSDSITIKRNTAAPRVPMGGQSQFPGAGAAQQGGMPRRMQKWYGDFGV